MVSSFNLLIRKKNLMGLGAIKSNLQCLILVFAAFCLVWLCHAGEVQAAVPQVTLQAAVNYPVGNNPYSVAAGDFNGDGKIDLTVANLNNNSVSVLLNYGDAPFRPR